MGRSTGMTSFLDKARDWRRRADELRSTADGMATPVAQSSLLDMATALEHHAANIEQITLKLRRARERAAAISSFHGFVLQQNITAGTRRRS